MTKKKVNLSENAEIVTRARYCRNNETSWEEVAERVARANSLNEKENIRNDLYEQFYEEISTMNFIPAGRILRNSGMVKGSLLNCFSVPINDSISDIGQCFKDILTLWSSGGGTGLNFSSLRNKGAEIKGKGGVSSGLVSFLKAADGLASTIESGAGRRAAGLAGVDISHPEVLDFINAKSKNGELSHFNISVIVTREFLTAVEKDDIWTFKFNNQNCGSMPAREIWDNIIDNMIKYAEPGILVWDNLTKNNSYYFENVGITNPCLTYETLISVADGRGAVSIGELAKEGKDVPVYSYNEKTNKVEVKMMRNPRVTGYDKKILKITLDNGSFVRCTENHKFYLRDGTIKEAKDLTENDSLHHMNKFNAGFQEMISKRNSKSQDYSWIVHSNSNQFYLDHRLIKEHEIGRPLVKGEVIHHIDSNGLNNIPENLIILNKQEHDKLHGLEMMGDNNPMRRFPEKNWLVTQDWSGEKNGRYKGYTESDMEEIAIRFMDSLGRRASKKEWKEFCKSNNYPHESNFTYGNKRMGQWLTKVYEKKYPNSNIISPSEIREYKKFIDIQETTDLDVYFDGAIKVRKSCEICSAEFVVPWMNRERAYCSLECSSKSEKRKINLKIKSIDTQKVTRDNQIEAYLELKKNLNRDPDAKEFQIECKNKKIPHRFRYPSENVTNPYAFHGYRELKEAANSYNFKVVKIEEDGFETVYNGTVDFNHNMYIQVATGVTENGKPNYSNILCRQCGEVPLPISNYGACCLGSLNLPNFITGSVNTNWKKLRNSIRLGVRFLDNILDLNQFEIPEMATSVQNSRRVGLGVMGLAEYLFAKQIRYGSMKSLVEIEKLMKFIRDIAYEASMELAMEKGSFPKFDPIQFGKASFVRKLPAKLRMDIKKNGIRNVTILSIAPTGTISLIPEVTGGIEPLFSKSFIRKDRLGERVYIHPLYQKFLIEGESVPEWYVDTNDLAPEDHLEVQALCQKYVCSAVSKTINMPTGTTPEQLSGLLLEYAQDVKGLTVYVDGSREGAPLNHISEAEAKEYIMKELSPMSEDEVKCKSGTCDL